MWTNLLHKGVKTIEGIIERAATHADIGLRATLFVQMQRGDVKYIHLADFSFGKLKLADFSIPTVSAYLFLDHHFQRQIPHFGLSTGRKPQSVAQQ